MVFEGRDVGFLVVMVFGCVPRLSGDKRAAVYGNKSFGSVVLLVWSGNGLWSESL